MRDPRVREPLLLSQRTNSSFDSFLSLLSILRDVCHSRDLPSTLDPPTPVHRLHLFRDHHPDPRHPTVYGCFSRLRMPRFASTSQAPLGISVFGVLQTISNGKLFV